MIEIDIHGYDTSIHLADEDDNTHTTVGLTFRDISKHSKFMERMREIRKQYNHLNPTDIIFTGSNMSVRGVGFLFKVKWDKACNSAGRVKVSFRVSEYEILSGKSMIRNSKLSNILNEA